MSGTDLTISSGNTIDVSTLQQTLSLSGTTLTISGTNGNVVDLSAFSGISSSSITDLSDVDTTGITVNQLLRWDGTEFVAFSIDASDLLDNTGRSFSGNYNDLTNKPTLPNDLLDLGITDGTAGQVLKTNGLGNFFFADETGGGGGGGGIELADSLKKKTVEHLELDLPHSATTGRFTFRPPDLSDYINSNTINQLGPHVTQTSPNTQLADKIELTDLSVTTATASGSGPSLAYDDLNRRVYIYTSDPSGLGGGGGSYANSDVDTHPNTSTATNGHTKLEWY